LSGNGLYQTKIIDNRSELGYLTNYDAVFDTFKSFSQFARKDNIFIADPLRYIFVQGRNSKTLTSKQREAGVSFSQHIYWPLRHMMTGGSKNSSYCVTYANWGFTNDKALNRGVWVPTSGFAAAAMGSTDSNFYPWIAPAGFTRGLLTGLSDLAFYPKQKERDQLYKIGLNPIANFPNEGFAIFGQKTMQAKPSAFDRINVRRLFLYLQKAVMNTVKYFVFEPNTLFTRTQVLNVLRPIFEEVKNTQGLYDYLIVCDDRNNSPDVIDRNELVVDIYIKPTRAAEFILVNFYATRTGQDFSELVS
jgi:phage tail sheath protein FI